MFQSSPAPKDGRYVKDAGRWSDPQTFQSSPAPKDGRYLLPRSKHASPLVSILARPEGRALQDCKVHGQHLSSGFNPRPPRRTGATSTTGGEKRVRGGFNPRPPRRTGATMVAGLANIRSCGFQSSPAPKDGRYAVVYRIGTRQGVSILARPEGRALPQLLSIPVLEGTFQSSPAPKDGRYAKRQASSFVIQIVSILARPEGRALPCEASICLLYGPGFNPRPPRRTGATKRSRAVQPSVIGFNPRPPRRTGATVLNQTTNKGQAVSILARPEGRALHPFVFALPYCKVFQSSPAPKDGRYLEQRSSVVPGCVSILARPEGRALRIKRYRGDMLSGFQSSPAPKDGRYAMNTTRLTTILGFNPRPPRRTGATI